MAEEIIAGIDIGGTKIAVALADSGGEIIAHTRFPTRVERGAHEAIDEAVETIERLRREHGGGRLVATGCGCGGPLDRRRGLILSPPNLPGWDEFPIVRLLEQALGVPVLLDNDANAAALGEHRYGAGRGLQNLVYVTISTGIGGGVIINDRLVHGTADAAGEVGHIIVEPGGTPCLCGSRGCLEAICSGTNIARRARERLTGGAQSRMQQIAGGIDAVTAHTVVEAARAGDPAALEIWDETIGFLATGLNNIIVTLAPQAVILGGGVATTGDLLLAPLRDELRRLVKIVPGEPVPILQAALGGDSALYGALMLGRQAAKLD